MASEVVKPSPEAQELPTMVFRKTAGTSLRDPHERVVAPAQIIKADGSMDIGVPVAISQSNSARSRALDRWMVVLTSPATTPDSKQYREAYQRVFYYMTTVNLIVAAVIVFMYARADSLSSPSVASSTPRLLQAGRSPLDDGTLEFAASFAAGEPDPAPAPELLPTFSAPNGQQEPSFESYFVPFLGTVAIGLFGAASVWALSPAGITVYMLACTLFFFYTVQSAPSFAFVVRYVFDIVLLYIADCLRSKLTPSWFAAQQFS